MAGFLHDVLEDSDITADNLLEAGIPESVVNALELLTHTKDEPYFDYIQRIIDSHNPVALKVKFNDLTHNYERGKAYPDLQAKQGKALQLVKEAIERANRVELYVPAEGTSYAIFAAGCFWGVQHYFNKQKGVIRTFAGYTGGTTDFPTYEEVRSHHTSHLEAILVEYDSDIVSYTDLCKLFFEIHDPAQTDGQGPDIGSQYLSGAFYVDEAQHATINELTEILRNKGHEVNTRIAPATKFWIAEQMHQNYYENTGGSPYCHIRMKKF
ncbi:MAG: peptide-methionine (S)-S-oxide reductase MsrA [Bacteroidaceae bacterium]|nr:peptide-methionine (S)-S-oxide reductase MsrA [Bacteroidaceae bacterium]